MINGSFVERQTDMSSISKFSKPAYFTTNMSESDILRQIKKKLGTPVNSDHVTFVEELEYFFRCQERKDNFVNAIRKIALEFTKNGHFSSETPSEKSLWKWLKRFFSDYMVIKTKTLPKNEEESRNLRKVLSNVTSKLKLSSKHEIFEKVCELEGNTD